MVLYNVFFREMVLRKKTDLTNPTYFMLGDVKLPRESLVVYPAANPAEYGPSNDAPLISNYGDVVNITFNTQYNIVIGKALPNTFNERKLIDAYRAKHFNYNWTRNPANAASRKQELLVDNLALAPHRYRFIVNRFTAFYRSYNQLHNTLTAINKDHELYPTRELFWRIELPPFLPSFKAFNQDLKYYLKAFEGGDQIKEINDQAIRLLKNYGAFWLWDWFLFLTGDLKHSQFNKLTEGALSKLHIVFTYNGLSIVIKPSIIKEWLDETSKPDLILTPLRVNAVKRVMIVLGKMIKQQDVTLGEAVVNNETEEEFVSAEAERTTSEKTGGLNSSGSGIGTSRESEEAESEWDENLDDSLDSVTLDNILNGNKKPNPSSNGLTGTTKEQTVDNPSEERTSEVSENAWTDEVDDNLFADEESLLSLSEESGNTTVSITPRTETRSNGIDKALEARAKAGKLTVLERDFFKKIGDSYKTIKMENGQTLEHFVEIPEKDIKDVDKPIAPKIVGLADDSMVESRTMRFKNNYSEKMLDRDVASMFLGIQQAEFAITDLRTEVVSNISGKFKVYYPTIHPVTGSPATRPIRIPVIGKDGSYRVDGQNRVKAIQRLDVGIRKLDDFRVGLTSYYGTRLIISRNRLNVNDRALKLSRQIKALGSAKDAELKYHVGNVFDSTIQAPRSLTSLARYFKAIEKGEYRFNFDLEALKASEDPAVLKAFNGYRVPCGKYNDKVMTIDEYGNIEVEGQHKGAIENILGVDTAQLPIDFAQINVRGFQFPIGVVLGYYLGFDKLIETLKVEYRTVPAGENPGLNAEEFALSFADEHVIFSTRDQIATLVFGGMRKLPSLGNFNRYDLNNEGVWVPLMNNPKVKPGHFKEMQLQRDMFIDPITAKELVKLGYPDQLDMLLIEAVKMLTNDQHLDEMDVTQQRLVGYELFAGILYHELVNATRQYRNKPADKRNTFDINPEAVITRIVSDTATDLRQDVNPGHEVKEQECFTSGGTFGRNEISMVRRTRRQNESYRGVVSEAGKDSGKAGYVNYLTSNAKIKDLRGNIDASIPDTESGVGSAIMNLMYGATIDDPKRQLFAGVQISRGTSAINYQPSIVSTAYDRAIAHRTSELYSKPALKDGKITAITKDGIIMTYVDGTTDTYALGLTLGKASGEVYRHTRVTDLKVGDTFKAGDIVGWDDVYFQRDFPYNPRQVVMKNGVNVRIALGENEFTFEDSMILSPDFAEETKSSYIKDVVFTVDFKDGIEGMVGIGDEVDLDTILCSIVDSSLLGLDDDLSAGSSLERLGLKQQRSNHHGKVVDFYVEYNGDVADMSKSLQAFVKNHDKRLKARDAMTHDGITSGNVAGNLNVGRVTVDPGKVSITVYIEDYEPSGVADKFVLGNQMKGTCGNIMRRVMKTIDGRVVDVMFSLKGMFNRMVLSMRNKMVAGELSRAVKNKFIKIYRG